MKCQDIFAGKKQRIATEPDAIPVQDCSRLSRVAIKMSHKSQDQRGVANVFPRQVKQGDGGQGADPFIVLFESAMDGLRVIGTHPGIAEYLASPIHGFPGCAGTEKAIQFLHADRAAWCGEGRDHGMCGAAGFVPAADTKNDKRLIVEFFTIAAMPGHNPPTDRTKSF